MNTKPSEWAEKVWKDVYCAYMRSATHGSGSIAAALVIEQARKEWEGEVVEWLRDDQTWQDVVNLTCPMRNSDTSRACHKIATMIENGSHRAALSEKG